MAILHSDLNNFYVSVECMERPELRNKPVAVVGDAEARHGIVLAKNYLAKGAGVKTGMVIWEAKQLCPGLITVGARFDLYLKYSRAVRRIYSDYTDRIELHCSQINGHENERKDRKFNIVESKGMRLFC